VQNHRIRRNVSAHIILLCPLLHCHFRKKISHEIVSIGYFDVAKFDIKPYDEKTRRKADRGNFAMAKFDIKPYTIIVFV
jgi:hypothetical protein